MKFTAILSSLFSLVILAGTAHAETYYFHNDHLGTPQALTDKDQNVVWKANYTPFGEANITKEDVEMNLRLPGQYFDQETGLHYNYFRDYDPSTGRYVQSDPIGLNGGINTYGYVAGNPLNSIDPFGLYCISVGGITTCRNPNGPAFSLPTPEGFPSYIGPEQFLYHNYDVGVPIGCADPEDVMQSLINNPTPGFPNAASVNGTTNNAVVAGIDNFVTSYLTTDINTGAPLLVNLSDSNSLFHPGYVVRTVNNGVALTYGEGLHWSQSDRLTGSIIQAIGNGVVWGSQMEGLVAECSCR